MGFLWNSSLLRRRTGPGSGYNSCATTVFRNDIDETYVTINNLDLQRTRFFRRVQHEAG